MKLSNNLSVSNTNGSGRNPSAVRIYKCGKMVAEVFINKRNPLGYLQSIKNGSKYLRELSRQLSENSDYAISHTNPSEAGSNWTLVLDDIKVLQKEAELNVHLS